MLHNIFETFYFCFSEIVKNKSAEDFQFGKYEDYLNLKLDQETVKIGFYKRYYQEIIKKSLDICFKISDFIDFESSEFVDEIASYKKFLDQDYSDITILADIFPSIIKKIRHIGLMLGVELSVPCNDLIQIALDEKLLINVTADNVIRLLPPLIINKSESQFLVDKLSTLIINFIEKN